MNKHGMKILGAALVLAAFLASCASVNLKDMTDDELVAAGVQKWNSGKTEDARPYWNNIRDESLKSKYLSAFDQVDDMVLAFDEAEVVPDTAPEEQAAAFAKARKLHDAFPANLNKPENLKPKLRAGTVNVVKTRVRALKFDSARAFAKEANAFLGESDVYDPWLKEADAYTAIAAQEREADQTLSAARATEDFNDRIAAYEKSTAVFKKVEDASSAELKTYGADSTLAAQNSKIRKKRADSVVEKERQLRERAYSFRERIGEEFARQPDPAMIGNMKPQDILNFNEERRANIEAEYQEMLAFGKRYPTVIDKDMIRDVEEQKTDLDKRISIIVQEVKTAKDIESRGKAAAPLMIGLFNPQPGTKAEEKKSRPAILKGTMKADKEYWWGMVSIDKGTYNDLVVTMKDSREVQVFGENTLSGSIISLKGLKSLISMKNKVGNSWPIINAGAVLPKSQYYIQLDKGSNATYNGEVVIYSSFIARSR